VNGVSVLDASQQPLEAHISLVLLKETGGVNDAKLVNVAFGGLVNLHGTPELAAAQAAREAGNAPNAVLAAAVALVGPNKLERARRITAQLIDGFAAAGLRDALDEGFDFARVRISGTESWFDATPDARAAAMLLGLRERGARSAFVRYLSRL